MTTPANPPDLITWLRAQLDDDERIAKRVEPNQAPTELRAMVTREGSPPFLVIDSARVLAEVDANRRILDLHADAVRMHRLMDETDADGKWDWLFRSEALEGVVSLLALPYAARPGYREEWRPA